MIEIGAPAPDFTLPSDEGADVALSGLRGKKVILYFYPKDDTPGCTVEACEFRDTLPDLEGLDATVLGVSADSVASHRKFKERYGLNFPLLADEDHRVSQAYDVWKKHPLFGMTIERSTFLIDEEGRIAGVWRKVKAKGHARKLKERIAAG